MIFERSGSQWLPDFHSIGLHFGSYVAASGLLHCLARRKVRHGEVLPRVVRAMALKSMTGFGRADGRAGALNWVWELRSVNGRGLDLRMRLPPGYEALEPRVRAGVSKACVRGSVTASLTVRRDGGIDAVRLNQSVLDEVLKISETLRSRVGGAPPTVEALLATRGVLEFGDGLAGDVVDEQSIEAIVVSLDHALAGLVAARIEEGGRLGEIFTRQLATIEQLVAEVAGSPARLPEAITKRLNEQVQRLLGTDVTQFDPGRLHQEAVLLATRADVEEELQRLSAHVAAAREMIGASGAVGRKLDFLTQEFNREANTLCSKSNDSEITRAGLALKTVIDQMREQVQNIE